MHITKEICWLIADLEYEIGIECYNPESYDGYNDVQGCSYRYPVSLPISQERYSQILDKVINKKRVPSKDLSKDKRFLKVKTKLSLVDNITEKDVKQMRYRFGANELYIGEGIVNVLEYLEKRYNLDFNQLEKNRGI